MEMAGVGRTLKIPLERVRPFDSESWFRTKKRYLANYERNLGMLIRAARKGRTRVLVLNMPFNYKLTPSFAHPQPESFVAAHRVQVRQGIAAVAPRVLKGDCAGALPRLDALLRLDPYPPVLHYLRAMCLERAGRLAQAAAAYSTCREQMIGNLGGILSINRIIARVAGSSDVEFVDVKQLFDRHGRARGKYFNDDLVHDECHPTPAGQVLIARELVARLRGR